MTTPSHNSLELLELTLRNFLTYGNQDIVIDLQQPGTTFVKGINHDTGDETANGVGKTTVLRGLVYALFDDPMDKAAKLDELINNINKKNMRVSLKFRKNGVTYTIIRQRKGKDGNTVHLYQEGIEQPITRDSVDNTNKYIEEIIGYSKELFIRIVVFSASSAPFFSLPTSGASKPTQAQLIEELVSLTFLSTKAEKKKKEIKENKQKIEIAKATIEQIEREQERHKQQLEKATARVEEWDIDRAEKLVEVAATLKKSKAINFAEQELLFSKIATLTKEQKELQTLLTRARDWMAQQVVKIEKAKEKVDALSGVDYDQEVKQHNRIAEASAYNAKYGTIVQKYKAWQSAQDAKIEQNTEWLASNQFDFIEQRELITKRDETAASIATFATKHLAQKKQIATLEGAIKKLSDEVSSLKDATCPYCNQHYAEAQEKCNHVAAERDAKVSELEELQSAYNDTQVALDDARKLADELASSCKFSTLEQLSKVETQVEGYKLAAITLVDEENPYTTELLEPLGDSVTDVEMAIQMVTMSMAANADMIADLKESLITDDADQARAFKAQVATMGEKLEALQDEQNPYGEMLVELTGSPKIPLGAADIRLQELKKEIAELDEGLLFVDVAELQKLKSDAELAKQRQKDLKEAVNPHAATLEDLMKMDLDQAKYEAVNQYTKLVDHQEFLVKLLTKSDSFIRKTLLDTTIPKLNESLASTLADLGLPHKVLFTNTLTADITEFGRPIPYHMLSAGQKARVNLALNWAFRDVLEDMHGRVNFCMLDEALDVGLCAVGVNKAISMLKRRARKNNMCMFVISHKADLDGVFDRQMLIERRNGFSRIAGENVVTKEEE